MGNQITEVRLLAVPLENDYKHTLHFSGRGTQTQYFLSKSSPAYTYTNLSYQRKERYISVPGSYEDLRNFNYVMYRNRQNSMNDWRYAFITRMEYKSDDVTWVYIETDVLQTYLTDYTIKASFVEREHTNDDTAGKNTIPENLECGEFVCHYLQEDSTLTALSVVCAVSETDPQWLPSDNIFDVPDGPALGLRQYSGAVSGLLYLTYPIDQLSKMSELVERYDEAGKADSIQAIFLCPSFLAPGIEVGANNEPILHGMGAEPSSFEIDVGGGIANSVDSSYVPRNKKLLTYPFKYLMVSNNAGASAVYHYELFDDKANSGMKFRVYGTLTPGCSIRMVPLNYKGVPENNEEGLNLGKLPICNWTSDAFTNWLTQNSVNIGLTLATGATSVAVGAGATVLGAIGGFGIGATAGVGMIAGGVSSIANQLTQVHQMKFTPDQSRGNINSGDVTTAMNKNTFTVYGMSIKTEYAEIIDGFFDMFGYKVNRVKVPFSNHRPEYWYTKTIDVSIDGNVPSDDMQKIKDCYNRGVTFWKNPENIGDYSVNNKI